MENDSRKKLIDKMFDAALKVRVSQWARKYDPEVLFETWVQVVKAGGGRACLGKPMWDQKMTIEQVLNCLDEYCNTTEFLIGKPKGKD